MIFSAKTRIAAKECDMVSSEKRDWYAVCLQITSCIAALMLPAAMIYMFLTVNSGASQVVLFTPAITEAVEYCGIGILVFTVLYYLWTFYLAFAYYQETPTVSPDKLPSCAVIVPAYNEGDHVLATLKSILDGDYPPEKLEIIAVNDGSTDDTLKWINHAAEHSGGRIKVIDLPINSGKRKAMYEGFKASTGDILVTVDSDSLIGKETLRRLLSPLAEDETVGGVAGNVGIINMDGGLCPRILDVNFAFSFDLSRAAQSAVRAVFCSPGALTACRRSVVMPDIEGWVEQKFMGKPANIGEDRALTNIILRHGYAVLFQRSAMVMTKVPETYDRLFRMMIRWGRSNVRENLDMLDFAFDPRKKVSYSRPAMIANLLMQLWWMTAPVMGVIFMLYFLTATLGMFAFALIPAIVLTSAVPVGYYLHRRGVSNPMAVYFYAIWGFCLLFWIVPYSLFSVHRSGWLTR